MMYLHCKGMGVVTEHVSSVAKATFNHVPVMTVFSIYGIHKDPVVVVRPPGRPPARAGGVGPGWDTAF